MARTSAGIVLVRRVDGAPEVLLVHPGGPLWARRDLGAWSVPKGEVGPEEDLLTAARRELAEEIGLTPEGPFEPLGSIRQGSGKIVHAWACPGDCDPGALVFGTFTLEWPPRSGVHREFPEVDRAAWFDLVEARRRVLPAQVPLLDRAEAWLTRP